MSEEVGHLIYCKIHLHVDQVTESLIVSVNFHNPVPTVVGSRTQDDSRLEIRIPLVELYPRLTLEFVSALTLTVYKLFLSRTYVDGEELSARYVGTQKYMSVSDGTTSAIERETVLIYTSEIILLQIRGPTWTEISYSTLASEISVCRFSNLHVSSVKVSIHRNRSLR